MKTLPEASTVTALAWLSFSVWICCVQAWVPSPLYLVTKLSVLPSATAVWVRSAVVEPVTNDAAWGLSAIE